MIHSRLSFCYKIYRRIALRASNSAPLEPRQYRATYYPTLLCEPYTYNMLSRWSTKRGFLSKNYKSIKRRLRSRAHIGPRMVPAKLTATFLASDVDFRFQVSIPVGTQGRGPMAMKDPRTVCYVIICVYLCSTYQKIDINL
jgi:hypothetical protein